MEFRVFCVNVFLGLVLLEDLEKFFRWIVQKIIIIGKFNWQLLIGCLIGISSFYEIEYDIFKR